MDWPHQRQRAVISPGMIALVILLVGCPAASALDPSLDVSQYAHTSWNFRDGFSKGRVTSVVQTPDGYLWLGTEFGLVRFDGLRGVPWQPPGGEQLPSDWIRALLAGPDGTLWIGTQKGLASWRDGKLTRYPALTGHDVYGLLVDHEGTIWAGGYQAVSATLCAIQRGTVRCQGAGSGLGGWVGSIYEDRRGDLWVTAQTGLWRWKPGPPTFHPLAEPAVGNPQVLAESDRGTLLIATQDGLHHLVDGKVDAFVLPGTVPSFNPQRLLRDRDGGLWIGTLDRGLLHVHQGRTDLFTQVNGLSGNSVASLFEDREGNIWVATVDGLDRFRNVPVHTISANQGLSSGSPWSVLAARDGSMWLGTNGGLSRWQDGRVTIYRKRSGLGLPHDNVGSLFEDHRGRIWVSTLGGVVYFENGRFVPVAGLPGGHTSSIVADTSGNLWMINDVEGLLHLFGGGVVERVPWATLGFKDPATILLADPVQGGVWLGFDGRVAHFKDGQVGTSYAVDDAGGEVNDLRFGRDGALWAATEHGLSQLKNGRVVTLSSKNGLPCDAVHWIFEDDNDSFWLYMPCGLARIGSAELNAAATDLKRRLQAAVFDGSDGVGLRARPTIYDPQVARSADGRLWFLPNGGVSVFDPRRLSTNKIPPLVQVEQVIADRKTYDPSSALRLPPLIRDLEIDYTALSFVAPEKNRFRVKLEGRDADWQDVGNRRQAFYTNLAPRKYRFRVTAANNSGVWNDAGAFVDLSIAPAYYQTRRFQAAVVAVVLALFWALHRLRVRQLAREFNLGLEARVSERTRIARELHDTLLQSFHGLLLRFQRATNQLPEGPVKQRFEGAIDEGAQAIAEGRDAVQGLRASTVETNDLAAAIDALGHALAADQPPELFTKFQVAVEGTPRDLHPILRDEAYRIAGEALRNAFRHAEARQIDVEIRYDAQQLRLRVHDDGKGMAARMPVGENGSRHYGLPGMHERATAVGGRLDIWSNINAGTEVELSIPAAIAYANPSTRHRSWTSWVTGHER